MKICLVTETYWPEVNGVAMTLQRWMLGLVKRGHDIHLVTPHHPARVRSAEFVSITTTPGVPLPNYTDVYFGLPAGRRLRKLLAVMQPDIVYVATEGPLGLSAVKAANRVGIPVVTGFHTNFHTYLAHYSLQFLRGVVQRHLVSMHNQAQCTLVPTNEQQAVLHNMGIPSVAVVGRGVDVQMFSGSKRCDALRDRWGVAADDPVLLSVGRVAPEKNLQLLLNAYTELRAQYPRLKLVVVGDGPALEQLRKEHPDVICPGILTGDHLATYYASADVFVFTSLTETFGNVVLEAMASRLAVVAFDYAAARLHIRPSVNGLLAAINDDAEFIGQVRKLLDNPRLVSKLRADASHYAATQSWDNVVRQLDGVLARYTASRSYAIKESVI